MITLFHGTNLDAGKSIISEKIIKHNIKRRFDESSGNPTTDGYVYLTDSIGFASYHGNSGNISLGLMNTCIFIFKITINKSLLSSDIDEYLYQNNTIIDSSNLHEYDYKRSLEDLATCRTNIPITNGNSIIEYVCIDNDTVKKIGEENWQLFVQNSLNVSTDKHKFDHLIFKHLTFKKM